MSQNAMLDAQTQDCIRDCLRCHAVCMDRVASTGQKHGGEKGIMLDCAELCMVTAHLLIRGSPLGGYGCTACAAACNHCAGMCEQTGESDCANACRACANSCEQLVKMIP